ncbi:hypothetical protein Poli38472_006426 [Pythium oligandrum]|uniref:Uncharacterized protein n=1 Tax=Pythium oligandrum TaxID=41045 RepID=A0A8K1FBS5_PYTOL|nr:hypothetical protein Poli38472_006426 [Pythium oligandrum]|eukprot:TMW56416.1 hypothetical protein Poli38472_006426 [Pythium oligandrum]
MNAGKTLYRAIRSGAVDSYDGVKMDWQRERQYENRLDDAKVIQQWTNRPLSMAILRAQFDQPVDIEGHKLLDQRLDAAFLALREMNDHNALIDNLTAQGAFAAKKRSSSVQYRVGDVVDVKDVGRGVIVSWSEERAHAFGKLHVTYDVLPDTSYQSDRSRLHQVPQDEIELVQDATPVHHPSVVLFFDGFRHGRHTPCASLAQRFPEDLTSEDTEPSVDIPHTPSILQLQFADEDKLTSYLRCNDHTITQLALAALEGKWISECGDEAQQQVREALKEVEQGNLRVARNYLEQVVEAFPSYAYAWSKLGTVELRAGNTSKALQHYERALDLKPHMMDALAGLGTCATRLRRWNVAHRAAMQLLRVQPSNETARLLLDNVIVSSL